MRPRCLNIVSCIWLEISFFFYIISPFLVANYFLSICFGACVSSPEWPCGAFQHGWRFRTLAPRCRSRSFEDLVCPYVASGLRSTYPFQQPPHSLSLCLHGPQREGPSIITGWPVTNRSAACSVFSQKSQLQVFGAFTQADGVSRSHCSPFIGDTRYLLSAGSSSCSSCRRPTASVPWAFFRPCATHGYANAVSDFRRRVKLPSGCSRLYSLRRHHRGHFAGSGIAAGYSDRSAANASASSSTSPLGIVHYPSPVLLRRAPAVTAETAVHVPALVQALKQTMTRTEAVGIAAPQLGVSLRVIVLDPYGDSRWKGEPTVCRRGEQRYRSAERELGGVKRERDVGTRVVERIETGGRGAFKVARPGSRRYGRGAGGMRSVGQSTGLGESSDGVEVEDTRETQKHHANHLSRREMVFGKLDELVRRKGKIRVGEEAVVDEVGSALENSELVEFECHDAQRNVRRLQSHLSIRTHSATTHKEENTGSATDDQSITGSALSFEQPLVIVNPVVHQVARVSEVNLEGCLSLPDQRGMEVVTATSPTAAANYQSI
eukprot:GHVT01100652.1.p1 GENE.GHVT01100652.1~~GHVT01100652.1.p1  ORF type:complete len:548 (+),score=36.41 GHVT01100652.1:386-2029(+)